MSQVIKKEITIDMGPRQKEFNRLAFRMAAQAAGRKSPVQPLLGNGPPRCNPKCRYHSANGQCALALTPAWKGPFHAAERHSTTSPSEKLCVPANNTAVELIEIIWKNTE